jgi:hypothetical protein
VTGTTVVAVIAESTVMVRVAVVVAPFRSVTVMANGLASVATVEVPMIRPVEFMARPAGSVAVKESVPYPPEAVTGVKLAAAPCVNVLLAVDGVKVIDPSTARLKFAEPVAPFTSVAVTLKVVTAMGALGVPEILPVVVEKVRPAGSVGLIARVSVPSPPEAVTGAKDDAAWP